MSKREKKPKKPTQVSIQRLANGNILVRWDAPIVIAPLDLMVMGYRKCNKLIAEDGYAVGFELDPSEYDDMVGKKLGVKAIDVGLEPIVKESKGR